MKILLLLLCILFLSGCNSEKDAPETTSSYGEEVSDIITIRIGTYRVDENATSYLWFYRDKKMYFCPDAENKPLEIYDNYEIRHNKVIATNSENVLELEIIDEATLKLGDKLYHFDPTTEYTYVDMDESAELKDDFSVMLDGSYHTEDKSSYLWFEDDEKMSYVPSVLLSSSRLLYYEIEGNKLFATDIKGTMVFEIVDNDTLKLGEVTYHFENTP